MHTTSNSGRIPDKLAEIKNLVGPKFHTRNELTTDVESSNNGGQYHNHHELSPLTELPFESTLSPLSPPPPPRTVTATSANNNTISNFQTKISLFSQIKGILTSKPRTIKHIERLFTELKVPTPNGQEKILFGGYVAKWTSTLFKKNNKDFLVLTKHCLCRFKNLDKVTKSFDFDDSLLSQHSRQSATVSTLEALNKKIVTAENIILSLSTVYAISQQTSPEPVIRIDYISSPKKHAFLKMYSQTLEQHELWLKSLRNAVRQAETIGPYLTEAQRSWMEQRLRSLHDFDENEKCLGAFRILLKALSDKERLENHEKETCIPMIFVMGRNNVYILPMNMSNSSTPDDYKLNHPLLVEEARPKEIDVSKYQYPLLCLTAIHADGKDDTFLLVFRNSTASMVRTILLSSTLCENILTEICSAVDAITIWWPQKSYKLIVPQIMLSTLVSADAKSNKGAGFERMIEAQCFAFRAPRYRIQYLIEYLVPNKRLTASFDVDNTPFRFVLLPPSDESEYESMYTNAELMVIFNSLRFHPMLHEIILQEISMFDLQIQQGPEGHKGQNMLAAILYDFLISNPRLRKLDLSGCGITCSTLSAIGYALMTGQSSLERLILKNNSLGTEEVQALASGIASHNTPIREIDLSSGQLNSISIESILHSLDTNKLEQLEHLSLAKNDCDLDPDTLVEFLAKTVALKILNLRGCSKFFRSPDTPIISMYALGMTRLTILDLGAVSLSHEEHLDALIAYMQSKAFECLRLFSIDHCELDGDVLAIIFAIVAGSPNRNKLKVWAGGNNISETEAGLANFCAAVRRNDTPYWLSMTDCRLGINTNQVVAVLSAFKDNASIEILDLSFPQFGIVAQSDKRPNPLVPVIAKQACEIIGQIFRENRVIKGLSLRGDGPKRWGPSLSGALKNLEDNPVLDKLNIRGNAIGDAGAKVLSSVLKANTSLKVLNIDENEISLDGYLLIHTILTTHQNTTLHQFTYPVVDLATHTQNLDTKIATRYRESILFSTAKLVADRTASEQQKFAYQKVLDEIVAVVKTHQMQNGMFYYKF